MDFNGAFGAYAFHTQELMDMAEILAANANAGVDITDQDVFESLCFQYHFNPKEMTSADWDFLDMEINKRL